MFIVNRYAKSAIYRKQIKFAFCYAKSAIYRKQIKFEDIS
jgi:hypothetical protein